MHRSNSKLPVWLLSWVALLSVWGVPALLRAQATPEDPAVTWYSGPLTAVDATNRMVEAEIAEAGQKPVIQRFLVQESALVTLDGTQATLQRLAAGQTAQLRAVQTASGLLTDVIRSCNAAAGGSGNGRSPIALLTLSGGGGNGGNGGQNGGDRGDSKLIERSPVGSNPIVRDPLGRGPVDKIDDRIDRTERILKDEFRELCDRLAEKLRRAAHLVEQTVDRADGDLGEARARLAQKLRRAADAAAELRDATGDKVRQTQQRLAEALHDAGDACDRVQHILDATGSNLQRLENQLGTMLHHAADCVEDLLVTTKETAFAVRAIAAAALADVADSADDLVDGVKAKAGDAYALLAMKLRRAAQGVEQTVERTVERTKDTLGDARRELAARLRQAAEAAGKLGEVADDKVGQAKQHLARLLHEAGEACDRVNELVASAQDRIHTVEGKLAQALHHTAEKVKDTLSDTKQTVAETKAQLLDAIRNCGDHADDLVDGVRAKAGDAYALLAMKLRRAAQGVEQTVERTVERTKDTLGDARRELAARLRQAAEAAGKLGEVADDKVGQAKQHLARLLHEAGEACDRVNELVASAQDRIHTVEGKLAQALHHTAEKVKDTLSDTKQTVAETKAQLLDAIRNCGDIAETLRTVTRKLEDGQVDGHIRVSARAAASFATGQDSIVNANTAAKVQVLLRGAVHEAFARPFAPQVKLEPVTRVAPPPPIQQAISRLAGERGMTWIDGYWSWNPVAQKYEWVSGIVRRAPPGRHWLPGRWVSTEDGFARIPGAWVSDKLSSLEHVDRVAEVQQIAPIGTRPGPDYFWVPVRWTKEQGIWRPGRGFWTQITRETSHLIWNPPQFLPTERGAVFVDGYWDHRLTERGVLMAPLSLSEHASPELAAKLATAVTMDPQRMTLHLFVNTRTQQYYFGDFYAAGRAQANLKPWFQHVLTPQVYDPLFEYYNRVYLSHGENLQTRLAGWHRFFVKTPAARPPHTLAALAHFLRDRAQDPLHATGVLAAGLNLDTLDSLLQAGLDAQQLQVLLGIPHDGQAGIGSLNVQGWNTLGSFQSIPTGALGSVGGIQGLGTNPLQGLGGVSNGGIGGASGFMGIGGLNGTGGMHSLGSPATVGGFSGIGGIGPGGTGPGGLNRLGGVSGPGAIGGIGGLGGPNRLGDITPGGGLPGRLPGIGGVGGLGAPGTLGGLGGTVPQGVGGVPK